MTREEINASLLTELAETKERGKLSDELKSLFYQMCRKNIDAEKYVDISEDIKYICVISAYEACVKHAIKFNPQKSGNAYAYLSQIIRSSFVSTLNGFIKWKKN